ncbi:MAG: hypothetical protein ACREOF_09075 [Gemmatimonadales bacterium]
MRFHPASIALVALCAPGCESRPAGDTARADADSATHAARSAAQPPSGQAPRDTGKVAQALSAAPPSITQNAAVMDWPARQGDQPLQLRAGSNGWTCFPATPQAAGAQGEDPMCLDARFADWATAWAARTPPKGTGVGIGYMLRGDAGVSNTDPFATGPTPDNQWVRSGPHVMVVVPNVTQLAGLPSDPKTGGPWVMWKGTPYAHLMVPVE